jgi:hypothetical protein
VIGLGEDLNDFKEYIASPSNEKLKERRQLGKLDLSISDEES